MGIFPDTQQHLRPDSLTAYVTIVSPGKQKFFISFYIKVDPYLG